MSWLVTLRTIFRSFFVALTLCAVLSGCGEAIHAKVELLKHGILYSVKNYQYAIYNGKIDIVRLFIEAGMNVDANRGIPRETPLLLAVDRNNIAICKLLIRHGANVNVITPTGLSPLIFASQEGYADIVALLIQSGAKVNMAESPNMTPLVIAAQNGHLDVVRLLVNAGAHLNGRNGSTTPLLRAVEGNYFSIVKYLVKIGANVNEENDSGTNALVVARIFRYSEIERFLIKNGAHVPKTRCSTAPSTAVPTAN